MLPAELRKRMRESRIANMRETLDNLLTRYAAELEEMGKQQNPRTPFAERLWGPLDSPQDTSEEPHAPEDPEISRR